MDTININYLEDKFNSLQSSDADGILGNIRKEGFKIFNKNGVPTTRSEEWKFTSINSIFKKEYNVTEEATISINEIDSMRLPGFKNADELVFINGRYSENFSTIRSSQAAVIIMPLEDALKSEYKNLILQHLDKSSLVIKDGIQALNTSFINESVFMYVKKNMVLENPVYVYHLSDARNNHRLSQPRSLIYIDQSAKLQLAESYATIGSMDSLTNEVMEIVVNDNAIIEYYKVQNDATNASQVTTTHIRQIGKSYAHAVTISLNGGLIRNNTNIIMEAEGNEAHLYGLYLLKGNTHVDNHTLVDNTKPNCFSNELYKGILDDSSSGVFSGKIFVRPDAQKTNAYQSNKNILLSGNATINTKPQLEIFADDVKCSHGCTIGQLDEEALFYLRTRGISKEHAQSMLLSAFAEDIVMQIKHEPLRVFVEKLITERLSIY
jgi:Fe-S cluster assembly protein SufD